MSRDRGGPALAGQILIMPMLDPGLSTCSMRDMQHGQVLEVADACAAAYRGYLPNAADRIHPYASPLQSEPSEKSATGADPVHRGRSAA
jgi:acetyl esterase/lipase